LCSDNFKQADKGMLHRGHLAEVGAVAAEGAPRLGIPRSQRRLPQPLRRSTPRRSGGSMYRSANNDAETHRKKRDEVEAAKSDATVSL
jgi:hypothetical protein